MSEQEQEPEQTTGPGQITDDQLPEDVRPGEDNPLAEPLDPDDDATKSREELGMWDTQDGGTDSGDPDAGPDSDSDTDE